MKRFREKSGASADLCDMYTEDSTFDVYEDRWEFAEHMNFFIPATARKAFTVSMGNAASTSSVKRKRTDAPDCDDFEENVRIHTTLRLP